MSLVFEFRSLNHQRWLAEVVGFFRHDGISWRWSGILPLSSLQHEWDVSCLSQTCPIRVDFGFSYQLNIVILEEMDFQPPLSNLKCDFLGESQASSFRSVDRRRTAPIASASVSFSSLLLFLACSLILGLDWGFFGCFVWCGVEAKMIQAGTFVWFRRIVLSCRLCFREIKTLSAGFVSLYGLYSILVVETRATMISDLPRDLAEEVLSMLPMTSLRGVRFTCKKWNNLTKNRSFTKKHNREAKVAAKNKQRTEFQVVMLLEYKVYLFRVNLLCDPSLERIGKLVSLGDATDRVDISKIFHCDGVLLCVTKDRARLVVWNPYTGQTRWIQPRNSYNRYDRYALGYERKNSYSLRDYKVLRFMDDYDSRVKQRITEFEIYSLDSDSWKVVHVNPDWEVENFQRGVTLKGNTYWYAREKVSIVAQGRARDISDQRDFLLCFDFTTERFGPRLPLPFHSFGNTVTLSSVREDQLAVLYQKAGAPASYTLKIWISSKVEPNAVSWNKLFLAVDMKPFTGFQFLNFGGSFFVDERKKVAVVLDIDRGKSCPTRNTAYFIGEKGYFKKVDLGGSVDGHCWPLVCSYVPSSVQIKQASPPEDHTLIY